MTNQVVKSVEFTVGEESVVVQRQPFILTRVSKIPVEADMLINFKPWTDREAMEVDSVSQETKEKLFVPRASYFKNMMKHIYKMSFDIQDKQMDRIII